MEKTITLTIEEVANIIETVISDIVEDGTVSVYHDEDTIYAAGNTNNKDWVKGWNICA